LPRYQYRCNTCDGQSTIDHLSSEIPIKCPKCDNDGSLIKLLTNFKTTKKKSSKEKIGQITEEFIKDSRAELKQQKRELDENR